MKISTVEVWSLGAVKWYAEHRDKDYIFQVGIKEYYGLHVSRGVKGAYRNIGTVLLYGYEFQALMKLEELFKSYGNEAIVERAFEEIPGEYKQALLDITWRVLKHLGELSPLKITVKIEDNFKITNIKFEQVYLD